MTCRVLVKSISLACTKESAFHLARSGLSETIIRAAFKSGSVVCNSVRVYTATLIIDYRMLLSKTSFSVESFRISPTVFVTFTIILKFYVYSVPRAECCAIWQEKNSPRGYIACNCLKVAK